MKRGTNLKLTLKVTSSIGFYGDFDLGIVDFHCEIVKELSSDGSFLFLPIIKDTHLLIGLFGHIEIALCV